MPRSAPIQTNFTAGEWSPRLEGRVDLSKYFNACKTLQNMIIFPHGGVTKRPGFYYVNEVKDSSKQVRLVPFEFSITQAYVLEFGDAYFRVYYDHGYVEAWTDKTSNTYWQCNANCGGWAAGKWTEAGPGMSLKIAAAATWHQGYRPTKLKVTHAASPADEVGVGPLANGNAYGAQNPYTSEDEITLDCTGDIDRINLNLTVEVTKIEFYDKYEVATPYGESDLAGLKYAQSADVMYLVHPDYKPRELTRTAHDSWSIAEITFTDGPYLTENDTATTIAPSATTGNISLTASAALFNANHVGALWRIKHGATWGYAEVTGYTSTTVVSATVKSAFGATAAVTTWREGAWSDYRGWPSAISFYEERLFFSGTSHQPQTLWGSMAGAYADFTAGTADDDPVTYTIAADQVNVIRWLTSAKQLLIGTVGGEWRMGSTSGNEPITPSNVQIVRETTYGSADIQSLHVGPAILFVQRAGRKVRELAYNFDIDGYLAPDMTKLAEHITKDAVEEFTYQQEPNSIIFGVRDDGVLLGFTYERREDVVGWHRHVTDGEIESVAVIPVSGGDELWIAVNRTIDGNTKRFIEYLTSFDFNSDLEDAFYVDSGLSYDGAPATTISGLDHLIGEAVAVLADGAVITGHTVDANGEITLAAAASKVHAGLAYTSILETMRVEAVSSEGTAQGKIKRIHAVTARVYEGVKFELGPDVDNLDEVNFDDDALFSGDVDIDDFPAGYEKQGRVYIKSDDPLPLTVSALMLRMAVHDG